MKALPLASLGPAVLVLLWAAACAAPPAPHVEAPRASAAAGPVATPAASTSADSTQAAPTPVAPTSAAPADGHAGSLELGDPYFPGLGNGGYDVEHCDLRLDVDMLSDELDATATLTVRALQELTSLSLDLYGLDVARVLVDGHEARFERPENPPAADGKARPPSELVIRPAQALAAGASFTLQVDYSGVPHVRPDPSVGFLPGVGWDRKESGVYVISECIGASSWLPCNDHPRDKATYGMRITVEKPYTVAANGLLREVEEHGDERTFVFDAPDPMASYLVTIDVAEFDTFEAEGPRGIPVRIYHPVDATEQELAPFRRQPEVLAFLESVFGPYPFVAAGGVLSYENIGGALECQTIPVYGRGSGEGGPGVLVHELAHQWFGDCVSPDLWRDVWLNEGFATYAGWLWVEHELGSPAYTGQAQSAYGALRRHRTGPPFDPGVQRVFSESVYTRGAMVLYGLRAEVGDEAFFRTLKTWVERNRFGNGSTAAFVKHAGETAGRDLTAFFDAWLYAPVTPEVPAFEPLEPAPATKSAGGG